MKTTLLCAGTRRQHDVKRSAPRTGSIRWVSWRLNLGDACLSYVRDAWLLSFSHGGIRGGIACTTITRRAARELLADIAKGDNNR